MNESASKTIRQVTIALIIVLGVTLNTLLLKGAEGSRDTTYIQDRIDLHEKQVKKIIQKSAREEAQYFCDKHPDRECFSELKSVSWYGSIFDMTGIELHLCDECLKEMFEQLENQFGTKLNDIEDL